MEKTLGGFALLGGLLEMLGALLSPWLGPQPLEPLYVATDLCLVFAVLGLYLPHQQLVGRLGLLGFCLALGGFALIAGPEAPLLGFSAYWLGKPVIGLGILLLAGVLWQCAPQSRWVSGLLLLSVLVGGLAMLGLAMTLLVLLSGLLFGAGFFILGWRQLRASGSPHEP
jgi:hypothetical protein